MVEVVLAAPKAKLVSDADVAGVKLLNWEDEESVRVEVEEVNPFCWCSCGSDVAGASAPILLVDSEVATPFGGAVEGARGLPE